jgi:DNA-binding transcriptional LysR family regulator
MYDSIAVYFFSDLSAYLATLYPSVKMELTVETSEKLSEKVMAGHIDLAIGVNLDRKQSAKLEFFKLFDDYYSFYVSSTFSGDKAKAPLLIHPYADDAAGRKVESHLAHLIKTRGAHRILNFETLKTLTLQNKGIGVLPTQVARPLIKQAQLVPINLPRERHLFGLHNIGFLAAESLMRTHRSFAEDIYRLGQRWSKS